MALPVRGEPVRESSPDRVEPHPPHPPDPVFRSCVYSGVGAGLRQASSDQNPQPHPRHPCADPADRLDHLSRRHIRSGSGILWQRGVSQVQSQPQRGGPEMEEQLLVRQESPNALSPELVEKVDTPALVYDEQKLRYLTDRGLEARQRAGCKLLYAVKAAAFSDVLEFLNPRIDGFAVSSLFEARFVRSLFPEAAIHFTAPGIRPAEVSELSGLCQFVALNSRSQVERYAAEFGSRASIGVRVNTRVSSVADPRYDPCKPGSKLGVPIEEVADVLAESPFEVEGLHFHTNADSTDLGELLTNVEALVAAVPDSRGIRWVNLGGGYLFEDAPLDPLIRAADLIRSRLGAEVILEPGAALVRGAGFLAASVLDAFDVDGSRVVVLDATVNHMPEVFEFSYRPDVVGHVDDGPFEYILAGGTCLSGDVFGTYRFVEPLEIGSIVVFEEAGAYTHAKAHRFNGVNLPEIGLVTADGRYTSRKVYSYLDFTSYWTTNV